MYYGRMYDNVGDNHSWLENWIDFSWFVDGTETHNVDYDHVVDLMRKGYTQGELIRETPDKGTIKGWWKKK